MRGVDRADHDLVSEHEALVDGIAADLARAVTARDAGKHENAVLA
jgi:hypothetical protein